MGIENAQLLLVRSRDLMVMGVRCRGFEVVGDSLVAGPGATMRVTLPPQAIAESSVAPGADLVSGGRLGGPSHLTFAFDAGASVPFTVDGILEALHGTATIAATAPVDEPALAIELPWRLSFSPRPSEPGDILQVDLPGMPVDGPSQASGLWRLRLGAAHGLALVPISPAGPDDDLFVPPLHRGWRERIVAEGSPPARPPMTPAIDLTSIGGSMTANGTWRAFAWKQQIVLGRDMAIHVQSEGVLYPFGHRAILAELTERVLEPGPRTTAVLRTTRTLLVSDRVRRPAADGPRAAREFPFDEVEILEPLFALGGTEVPTVDRDGNGVPEQALYPRSPKRLDVLVEDLRVQTEARDARDAEIGVLLEQQRVAVVENFRLLEEQLGGALGGVNAQIAEIEAAAAAHAAFLTTIPVTTGTTEPVFLGPDGIDGGPPPEPPPPPPEPGPPPPDLTPLPGLRAEAASLFAQLEALPGQRQGSLDALATEDGLAQFGFEDTLVQARQLRADVAAREQHLLAVRTAADQRHVAFEWPLGLDGARLRVPLRLGDTLLRSPVLFVHDLAFEDSEDFPAFASLTDPLVLTELRGTWQASQGGTVPIPAVRMDLVRSATPQPADVHEVHEITIGALPQGEGFRPRLDRIVVDLPTVRSLLPEAESRVAVEFAEAYLDQGDLHDIALRLPESLDIDFTTRADRSGGLVAPAFSADVISRAQGLVDAATLPGALTGPPNLATVFAGAKLLGIDLASVIAGVPEPLGIVPIVENGRPVGARMTWNLKLRDHGPLRVRPSSSVTLNVEHSPATSSTTCTVTDFDFVLPPGGEELLRLHFDALTYSQVPGRAPRLDVRGLDVSLGGDLGLLKTLQDAVDLGSAAPVIKATPKGVTAHYTLAVPEVSAGMFVLRNITVRVGVDVPFDGRAVVATLSFSTRDEPFNLSVSAFGGGGYLSFQIAEEGIRQLEASLDFGASVAIGVGIATAEVHALGGVRFELQADGDVRVAGFIRIGGSVDVLGLVSVSIELKVELSYDGSALVGRASVVIEIDVTFWSGSVELDSGEYVLAGAAADVVADDGELVAATSLADWQDYRAAFTRVPA